MQNMESGKHNPPGLSDADMDAWDFANSGKVRAGRKKVDHNEVIKIRSEYAKKQESFLHPKTDADSAKTATFTNQEAEDLAFGAIKERVNRMPSCLVSLRTENRLHMIK